MERVATLGIVTVIALFVWALAESQTLQTEELSFEVLIDPGGSGRALRRAPGEQWDTRLRVEVDGPNAAIDSIRERTLDEPVRLRLGEEIPVAEGEVVVEMREAVSAATMFAGRGVRIRRADPPRVSIEVEPLARRMLPVTVVLDAGEADRPPTPEPAEVEVTLPVAWLDQLPDSVLATVSAASLASLRPGEPSVVPGVPVSVQEMPQGAWGMTFNPPQISATVTLRRRTQEAIIPEVPIEIAMPPDLVGSWRVRIPDDRRSLFNVRVRGTSASVARVIGGQVRVRAIIELTREDLVAGATTHPAKLIGLPQGVGTVDPEFNIPLQISPIEPTPSE
ncbi:MAG: hypothetical protein CMJ31_12145 [Phycisphaerae bacterium]|nr:hypothetical protein [Phycisphaerae bacterium]